MEQALSHRPTKTLHLALWGAQGLLALAFLGSGSAKATQPIAELAAQMSFVNYTPEALVRFIGVVEILGALGLVLPSLTRILPRLTPLAALGLATVMLLAAGTHATHGELGMLPVNFTLGAIALFIAWGRGKASPIEAR